MLKKVLSILVCTALVLSTFAFTVSADTAVLVDGYTDASGNFYAGHDLSSAPNGWSAPSDGVSWNGGESGNRCARMYSGTGIETSIYSFVADTEYKIYAAMDGEGDNAAAILSIGGVQVGETITVGRPGVYKEFSWTYTATATGNATININRSGNTLKVQYIRVEQVGEGSGETTDPGEGGEEGGDTPSTPSETTILTNQYTDASGNFYAGHSSGSATAGWSGNSYGWNSTVSTGEYAARVGGGNKISTSEYSFEAGVEYTIYAYVQTERGSGGTVSLYVNDTEISSAQPLTNGVATLVSWKYTAETTGAHTLSIGGNDTTRISYLRVEYVAAAVAPVAYAINSVKGSDGVEITKGATGISYDITSITVEFNQAIDQAVLDAITVTGATVDSKAIADETKAVITISGLAPEGTYSLNIASLTNDGGTMEAAQYGFTCEAAQLPAVASVKAGEVTLTENAVIPYTTDSIVVAFDTGILASSVNATSVALTGAAYTVAAEGNTAVITITEDFRTLAPVVLTVSGVQNVYGGAMTTPYVLNLTTSGVDKVIAKLEGEDTTSWTYVQGEYGANVGETGVTVCGGDSSITSKALNLTAGTTYRVDVRAAKNSGYKNDAATSFNVTIGDKTEKITLPSEYDVFDVYSFEYTPAETGAATIFIQRSGGYCNFDIDYAAVTAVGAGHVIEFSAKAAGTTVTAAIYGVDNGTDVYLALYGEKGELVKCYKQDYAGDDVVFTTEVTYKSAIAYLWADGTVTPLVPAAPVQ